MAEQFVVHNDGLLDAISNSCHTYVKDDMTILLLSGVQFPLKGKSPIECLQLIVAMLMT